MDSWDRDYETKIQQLNSPAEPESLYWHLFYKGEKINGGIAGSLEEVEERIRKYRMSHTRSMVVESHVWDLETATWIPKSELNYG